MASFVSELKRRNVFRVGIAYAVGGSLIAEIAGTLEDALSLPEWFDTVFVVALLIGFPVALIVSWAYEMTSKGLVKTAEVDADASITHSTGKRLNVITIGAVVLLIAAFFARPYIAPSNGLGAGARDITASTSGSASIAVLPFVNLSSDPEQEYFSDGISEEILNVLAKVPDLHVTSRSSAFAFKGKDINIPDVARQLGVAHVLEGSVRKSGTTLRITAQLIEAGGDKHLWSETYDRELENVFEIQDEISAAIVEALKTSLGVGGTIAPVTVAKTANPEAYTEYLLGQHAIKKRTRPDIEVALGHFEKAVALDDQYAPAYSGLALAHYLLSNTPGAYGIRPFGEILLEAEPGLDRALALDPNNSEAHAVRGLILNSQRDYERANTFYKRAIELNPSNINARVWYAQNVASLGQVREQFEAYKEAYRIGPLEPLVLTNYVAALNERAIFDEQEEVLRRFETVDPGPAAYRRVAMMMTQGKLAEAVIYGLEAMEKYPNVLRLRSTVSIAIGKMGLVDEGRRLWPDPDNPGGYIGQTASAEERLEAARKVYEADPENPGLIYNVMFGYWGVGDFAQAEALARRILRGLPENQRPTDFANWVIAIADWRRGDKEAAEARLAPIEAIMNNAIDAGLKDNVFQGAAIAQMIHGNREASLDYMRQYIDIGDYDIDVMKSINKMLNVTDDADFVALVQEVEDYIASSRRTIIEAACSDPGFAVWKPLLETCAAVG